MSNSSIGVKGTLAGALSGVIATAIGAAIVHYGIVSRLDERVKMLSADDYFNNKLAVAKRDLDIARDDAVTRASREMDSRLLHGRVPIGTIISHFGTGSPSEDYLICDGRSFAKADYPQLYETLFLLNPALVQRDSARTPNLANRFLRGAAGSDRPVGKEEDDMVKSHSHAHTHALLTPESSGAEWIGGSGQETKSVTAGGERGSDSKYSLVGSSVVATIGRSGPESLGPSEPGLGTETRPVNTAVLFLIRAR